MRDSLPDWEASPDPTAHAMYMCRALQLSSRAWHLQSNRWHTAPCQSLTLARRALQLMCRSFIELDLPLLIDSAFAAGAAMISFGAVLGKTTPAQITWLLAMQVPIYAFNAYLVTEASPSVSHRAVFIYAC